MKHGSLREVLGALLEPFAGLSFWEIGQICMLVGFFVLCVLPLLVLILYML